MRRRWGIAIAVVLVLGGMSSQARAATPAGSRRSRIPVVAAFYPIAYAAKQVGAELVSVTNLTPAGAEPHDLELTPDQRDRVEDAALVLVMGNGFQPAVEAAADRRDEGTVELLRRLPIDGTGKRVADEGGAGTDDARDPHVWLDPALMGAIADEIADELGTVSPKDRAEFAANAAAFRTELDALDARYRATLADCRQDVIVTSHEAFGYLAKAYGFEQVGVAGISPDDEPDPKRLGELADLVERRGISTIFTEALVSPRIAQTLAREAGGVKVAVLNPLEGLTTKEIKAGDDYFTVMDRNLEQLRAALDCG